MDEFEHNGNMSDYFDAESDYLLEQQELSDFAQDGYFDNMEACGEGTWS